MADKQTARALASQRERYMGQIRQCAERLQRDAGYVLARIDADTTPAGFSLVEDAATIDKCRWALEAMDETQGVYEAELAEAGS